MVLISACLCSFGKFPVFLFALVAPWVSRRHYDQTVFFQQFLHTDCGNLLDVRSSWQLHFLLTLAQKLSNSNFQAASRNILKLLGQFARNKAYFWLCCVLGKVRLGALVNFGHPFSNKLLQGAKPTRGRSDWNVVNETPAPAVVIDFYTIYRSIYCTATNHKMQCSDKMRANFACIEALRASCSSSISPSSWTQSFRKKFFTELWFCASRSQRWDMLFCSSIRTPSKREDSCRAEIAL